MVQVNVNSGNIEQSLRVLKKKLQREGVFRSIKLKRYFETNGEKRKRRSEEAQRRKRKGSGSY